MNLSPEQYRKVTTSVKLDCELMERDEVLGDEMLTDMLVHSYPQRESQDN